MQLRPVVLLLCAIALSGLSCQRPQPTASPLIATATPSTTAVSGQINLQPAVTLVPTPTLRTTTAPAPTQPPQPLPTTASTPAATPIAPDSGWQEVEAGVEKRVINLRREGYTQPYETLYILRIDPSRFVFDIAYDPGGGRTLTQWLHDTQATVVVNGGFFTEEKLATGLTIVDGQSSGASYGPFAGMIAIQDQSIDIRWLTTTPYDPAEPLTAALQSFPILVKPGGTIGFPADKETGRRARRTVIGQDTAGRILLIITPRGQFTLHEISAYLTQSDLGLDTAINLDGGPSSGLLMKNEQGLDDGYASFTTLPIIITVSKSEE